MSQILKKILVLNFLCLCCVNASRNLKNGTSTVNRTENSISNTNDGSDIFLVTGGSRADVSEQIYNKYLVSIRYKKVKHTFGENHICGGSILAPGLILTAAHCIYIPGRGPMNSDDIEVVAGTPKRLQKVNTTQSSIAEKLVVHRRYVSFSVQYDIGLIKLKDEFKLNEYAVAAISLPTSAPVDGMECTLLGWGRMYQNGPLPDAVLYVSLDLLTYKSCKERLIIINAGNICGWDPNNNMKGACKGDSGGPLICDDCVSGIVSYGMDCDVGVPDAYTNVHYFLKWIEKNMAYKITITKYHHFLCILLMLSILK